MRSGMVRFHDALDPLMVPIDSIQPAPYNYNNGDVDAIAQSIEQVGMYRPVYVRAETREIIAGNHTWMACKQLGSEVIPVVEFDGDDTDAKIAMIGDNHIASLARPDQGQLLELLEAIQEDRGNVAGTGLTEQEVEMIRLLNDIPLETDEFANWPTFSVRVPPHVLGAFRYLTREADDDRQAFELLLRLAGWDGKATHD